MFACLLVPDFPVQAALLLEPKDTRELLRRSAMAVLNGPSNLPKVVAVNDAARDVGIEAGMTKLQVETCGGCCENDLPIRKMLRKPRVLECAAGFSPALNLPALERRFLI
jgi:hypothetical protein